MELWDEGRNADEEMTQADRELQEMGYAAMDRLYRAGADPEDVRHVGWLAGLTDWKPRADRRAA